ncbi:MAG: Ig-like domain-containing protein [Paludibacteraceae bacterium]|nr:Ig-like domain-containing protein [Paludibacteraceae bacterium]
MKTLTNNKNTSIWKWMLLLLFMLLNVQLVCATTLTEGFDNGTTAPTGWTFTSIGGTYTTSGNYGASSPSLKMDATSDRIVTPTLSGAATALSFWIKGQGTDASSALLVEAYNGSTWTTIVNITSSLPTTGTTKSYTFSSSLNYVQFRFTYTKSVGNLSFDDVNITYSSGSCTPPTLSFATTSYSKTVGDATFTQTAISNSGGAISYASSNTSIASVNSSTGAITLGSTTGTATITATQVASGSYCAATATYTVTVSAASCTAPSLSFVTASYSKILGDATFTQTATSNSSGAISYSSSNSSIASVNSSTGAITLGSTTGSATITATQAALGSYCAATATYTINLSATASSCPIIEGAMINSCGTNEGPNEFLVFSTTSSAAVSAYTLYYGSGSTPKSGASAILAGAAATAKTGTGSVVSSCTVTYVTSSSTVIPANSRVVFIPSDLDQAYDLSALCNGGSLYVVYVGRTSPSSWSLGGNFANSAGDRYLQLVNSGSDCTSNIVMYNSGNFSSNADGNFVSWDSNGNATYSNNGCSVVPPTCTTPIITGTSSVAVGSTTTLSSSLSGGTWSSANTTIATVNASGVVTAIAAGTVDISYTVGACIGYKTVTINPLPTALVLTGSTICSGATTTITSSTSVSGVNYQLYNNSNTAVGSAKTGTGAALSWSGIAAGTGYYVIGTNATTTCTSTSNTVTVKVNALPTISGTLTICGTGTTTLTGLGTPATSSPWTSATTTTATVSGTSTTGTVIGIAAGTSVITYKDNNGCSNTATVTVNTLPSISGVTSGTACGSGTITLGATASAGTINWYSSLSGTTNLGTGVSYTTGTLSATTYYYVDATANGCTSSSRTKVTAKVYPLSTTWTGAVSSDWDDDGNWTNGAPSCCTNVIIDSVGYYPTISSTGCCNNITFDPEAGILGIQKLVYKKAFVKMILQRNKWYTLTAPLKNMYSGDYYFNGGTPVSYMRLFDAINPDSLTTGGIKNIGTWTSSFASLAVPLNKGKSFTFNIDTISWNYPHGKTFIKTDQTITFPRMNADSSLITQMIPYAAFTGKPLTLIATTVARYDSAYRFMMENSSNQLTNQTITLQKGLNLIGNPLMTHLNFDNLHNHNSSVIRNVVKFWNGSTFVSYMTGAAIGSTMGLSASSIPPMQSFFVYSDNGGSMTIDLSSDFTATATGRLRSAGVESNRLYIESNNGLKTSTTSLAMTDSAPNEFDAQDAFKLFSQYKDVPEIYTLADNKPLDINQFGTLPYTAPLGIQSSVKDTISFSFKGADSFDNIDVSLINTKTGENQNLKENSTYKYNYDGTNGEGVLFVQFKSANTESTSGVKSNTSGSDIQIYGVNKEKIRAISSPEDLIKDIIVYDESGRTIAQAKEISASWHDVPVESANHVCIVKVITNKQVKVSKIILK